MNNKQIFKRLHELKSLHDKIALATVVNTRGSTPREKGAKMIIFPNGKFEGTIGGGCGEAEVWQTAMEALKMNQNTLGLSPGLLPDKDSCSRPTTPEPLDIILPFQYIPICSYFIQA